jgi:hypothetical protein
MSPCTRLFVFFAVVAYVLAAAAMRSAADDAPRVSHSACTYPKPNPQPPVRGTPTQTTNNPWTVTSGGSSSAAAANSLPWPFGVVFSTTVATVMLLRVY